MKGSGFNRRSPSPNLVDGVPILKPIRVARHAANGGMPGTGHSTPEDTTPRAAHRPGKRRRAVLAFQSALLVLVGLLVFRQTTDFRAAERADIPGSPVRKRQLIADAAGAQPADARLPPRLAQALFSDVDEDGVTMFPGNRSVSEVFAHPTVGPDPDGPTAYIYRFTNVRLGEGGRVLEFFGGGAPAPAEATWYDPSAANSSSPAPPTHIVMGQRTLSVRYMPQRRPRTACARWIESPALLVHVDAPRDKWATWGRGLLPAFQTLRELGYLPLMEVGAEGKVEELQEGIAAGECPAVADPATGAARPAAECTQRHPVVDQGRTYCSTNDAWCVLGVWPHVAHLRSPHPAVLASSDAVLDNPWGALYSAMAGGGVRTWDDLEEGTCLRNLIVGMSRTVGLEGAVPGAGESGAPADAADRTADALDAFSRFTRGALHRLMANNAIDFEGYPMWAFEKMRQGMALGRGRYIDLAFKPYKIKDSWKGEPSPLADDWELLEKSSWLFSGTRESLTPRDAAKRAARDAALGVSPSPLGPPRGYQPEHPLPVVTYVSRWPALHNAILNDRQVLRYIYWRYNVTLRVSTMEEHEGAAAALLATTDVLIAPPGLHWMNVAFLKPGAATLQLLPYGWRRDDGSLLRGDEVAPLVHLRRGSHLDWVNPHAAYSFFRLLDFAGGEAGAGGEPFRQHPDEGVGEGWDAPDGDDPHPAWLNANTYADLNHLGPYIDEVMAQVGATQVDPAVLDDIIEAEQEAALASVYARKKAARAARRKRRKAKREEEEEEEEEEGDGGAEEEAPEEAEEEVEEEVELEEGVDPEEAIDAAAAEEEALEVEYEDDAGDSYGEEEE